MAKRNGRTSVAAKEEEQPRSANGYETTGVCFYCREDLEAMQPGGKDVRHVKTKIVYGKCAQALRFR